MARKTTPIVLEKAEPEPVAPPDDEFLERLRLLIERTTGGSVGAFAGLARMPPSTIHKYLQRGTDPGRLSLMRLAAAGGVSVGWLANGEGAGPAGPSNDDVWECPLFEAELSAGSGREGWSGQTPVDVLRLPGQLVRNVFRPRGRTIALRVAGDSMEPTIRDSALAILDTAADRIDRDGQVYALRVDDALLIKRAHILPGTGVRLVSDNSHSPQVQLDIADAERLSVLGRVCGVINKV